MREVHTIKKFPNLGGLGISFEPSVSAFLVLMLDAEMVNILLSIAVSLIILFYAGIRKLILLD